MPLKDTGYITKTWWQICAERAYLTTIIQKVARSGMALRMRFFLKVSLILSLTFTSVSSADERHDEHPPAERLKVNLGIFLIDSFDTTFRFDSTQLPIGTLIDLENNLNVDSSETVGRMDGFYRFNKRHRINWTYYRSRRDGGVAIATDRYIIGDPDDPEGGIIIPAGANISTTWNFDLLKLGYDWSFLNKRRYEMFIGAGLNFRNLDVEIAYQTDIAGFSERDKFEEEGIIPLPTFDVGGRWNITNKWQANFKYELFMLEFGNYKGSQQEFIMSLEHNTFKNLGFGLGLNAINTNLRTQGDNFRGEFDSRILGLLGYTKIYF
jgi:hypothetical protein